MLLVVRKILWHRACRYLSASDTDAGAAPSSARLFTLRIGYDCHRIFTTHNHSAQWLTGQKIWPSTYLCFVRSRRYQGGAEGDRARSIGLEFAIFRNRKNVGESELTLGGAREIRVVPVITGSKRAGILQTIIGIVLIVASPFTNGATLAPGIALAAGALSKC